MLRQRLSRRKVFIGAAIALAGFAASIIAVVIAQSGGPADPTEIPSSMRPVDCEKAGDRYVGPFVNKCPIAVEPDLPDPDTLPPPEDHGVYRIYPWGAPVDPNDFGPTATPGSVRARYVTEDEARGFEIFVEPSYLPDGYELTEINGVAAGDREINVSLYYEGEDAPLSVGRSRIEEGRKIYIQRASDATGRIIELTTLKGLPAIVDYPGPDSRSKSGVKFRVVDDGVQILVNGRAVTVEEARRIAESLIR